jgi:uncharacterized protein (TIGR03000 family)
MSMRLIKFVAPIILAVAAGPASAQHGGHGGGGHAGGGYHGGGGYHAGYGGYHAGYGGYRGGYYRGYGGYRGYGYGGYGYGYPYYGYGLGYGLGYGGYGYGLGYGGYGYSYPYSSGYSYPNTYGGTYYPSSTPALTGSGIVQTSGYTPATSVTSTEAAPATVTLIVPNDAKVWFNGKEDTTTGTSRVFTSPTLQPGESSVLSVKARWDGNDRTVQLPIQAGDKMRVDLRETP